SGATRVAARDWRQRDPLRASGARRVSGRGRPPGGAGVEAGVQRTGDRLLVARAGVAGASVADEECTPCRRVSNGARGVTRRRRHIAAGGGGVVCRGGDAVGRSLVLTGAGDRAGGIGPGVATCAAGSPT